MLASYGGDYRYVPLDAKAEYFEWLLWRYNWMPGAQVYDWVMLDDKPGVAPRYVPCSDTSTWNGALLSALSYKYAVTKDPQTLVEIGRVLQGMHLCLEVTGQPGLIARSVNLVGGIPPDPNATEYVSPAGTHYLYLGNPAKGTYNQVVTGYAQVLMHAGPDLPPEVRQLAETDLTAMVLHVVDHDYHLTNRDGKRTPYGDLTPLVGSIGVPFNAQVAYMIVAAGHAFYPAAGDPAGRARIDSQFQRLRFDHHVYYEKPLLSLMPPQNIGASPLLKGMNDRNHVTSAAFTGLEIERFQAGREGRPPDTKFVYELGQTMHWSMRTLATQKNSLANFMWCGILQDEATLQAIEPREAERTRAGLARLMNDGVEQLRRYPLDRFLHEGREVETGQPQWIDARRPDNYQWKCNPRLAWERTGATTNNLYFAVDYLHAYWLMRYYGLDQHPGLVPAAQHVLQNSGH